MIAGWILALVFAMLKRILERALGGAPLRGPQHEGIKRPRSEPPKDDNVIDTIWVGMSAAQLQAVFGDPASQQSNNDGSVLWSYPNMSVTLERNAVKGWTYKT